mmetsp:Transcript_12314/g.27329  ORF Transcript_12314/g.27329 Transcript_12314/m.27329 type:complete len:269 (+) Transcript_12314:47-853(+)
MVDGSVWRLAAEVSELAALRQHVLNLQESQELLCKGLQAELLAERQARLKLQATLEARLDLIAQDVPQMVHRALQEAGLVMGESTVINVGTSKLATETIDATQKDPLDRGVECKTTTGVKVPPLPLGAVSSSTTEVVKVRQSDMFAPSPRILQLRQEFVDSRQTPNRGEQASSPKEACAKRTLDRAVPSQCRPGSDEEAACMTVECSQTSASVVAVEITPELRNMKERWRLIQLETTRLQELLQAGRQGSTSSSPLQSRLSDTPSAEH